ncbi:hypothetical protein [Roseimicrobium sp. ORNL1]|uniref:hypothetical protein n=1 Tax=Roseimicrobium sp. ORNL1 TaxID=2711231 RepID=UPI0013E10889|nr:hypothetical protein [Roseimicrobium sp. ORNL1]QIF02491.1 hypothetical protein G5S37_13460 [Roseimicrobium sp. ORNL1]
MSKHLVPILADAMRAYYTGDELHELFGLFDSELEWDHSRGEPAHIAIAKRLVTQMEHANNRRILEALMPSLFVRCSEMIAKTSWERRDFHEEMSKRLEKLRPLLDGPTTPIEISVSDAKPFTAKSEIRDLVAQSEGPILLVDAYIGINTLDCFRDVAHSIRILTGQQRQSIETSFDAAARDFLAEGRVLEIRRHSKLHDRYLIFNDRCWLVGGSIKDAGKKALNVIECIDSKGAIVADAETKWKEATAYM